MKIQHTN